MTEQKNTNFFASVLTSGTNDYRDPLFIYSKGHREYTTLPIIGEPGISSIVENINILNKDISESTSNQVSQTHVKLLRQSITEDIAIEKENSGLSVNLGFSINNVITTDNKYLNL